VKKRLNGGRGGQILIFLSSVIWKTNG